MAVVSDHLKTLVRGPAQFDWCDLAVQVIVDLSTSFHSATV
jgi:hypothetical protein